MLDRVLESTSTKEKMSKYQAAVFKQSGAQPVSSHTPAEMDTGASQPPKFLSSVSLSVVHQDVTPEAVDQKRPPAPQCNGEWATIHGCEAETCSTA